MVRPRHASFKLNMRWCSRYPSTPKPPEDRHARWHSPDPRPRPSLPDFSPAWYVKSFHFQQDFPHRSLSYSIACISGTRSIRYLYCHVATSGALAASHHRTRKRNWPLTRDILRNRGEHCCASLLGRLPHCPTFSKNSATSHLVSLC